MIINHKERIITIDSMEEMKNDDSPLEVKYLNQNKGIFYLTVEQKSSIEPIEVLLKNIEPAYHYLNRFDIHDYKIVLKEKKYE